MVTLKLDENVPAAAATLLRAAGHDVVTVRDEGLAGADDDRLLAAAVVEGRALLTLDLHFSDIRRHPPRETAGIIVLRLRDQTFGPVSRAVTALAALLSREPLTGRLWVLDEHRLRIWPGATGPA